MQQESILKPSSVLTQINRRSSTNSSSDKRKLRDPQCALCQNHGTRVPIKGHKRYCPWRECTCPKCGVTQSRRKFVASQVAIRRAQVEDKERKRQLLETESKANERKRQLVETESKNIERKRQPLEKKSKDNDESGSKRNENKLTFKVSTFSPGSLSSVFDSRERFQEPAGFNSTQSMHNTPVPVQTLNEIYWCSPANNPIYRFWENLGNLKLAASKIIEASYGSKLRNRLQHHQNFNLPNSQYAFQPPPHQSSLSYYPIYLTDCNYYNL